MTTTPDRSKHRFAIAVVSQDGTRRTFTNQDQETVDLVVTRVPSGLGMVLHETPAYIGASEAIRVFGPGDIARVGIQRTADAEEGK